MMMHRGDGGVCGWLFTERQVGKLREGNEC